MDWKDRFKPRKRPAATLLKRSITEEEKKAEQAFFRDNIEKLLKLIEPCEDEEVAFQKLVDFADGKVEASRLALFVKKFWRK